MTKSETLQILALLKVAYPNSFNGMHEADVTAFVNLWERQFKEYDYITVQNAVDSIISSDTSGFAPSVGKVKEMIIKLNEPDELSEQEAWNLVAKAARNGIRSAKEEFDKLPPLVQKILGSHTVIYEYAIMDSQQFNTVAASNFMRSYRVRAKHAKEMMALPIEVKKILGIATDSIKKIE